MTTHLRRPEPVRMHARSQHELVVRGEVGDRFAPVFEGMRLERASGRTVITGPVRDQAQLHGLIERIRESGSSWFRSFRFDEPRRQHANA